MTTIDVSRIGPLPHEQAMALQSEELERSVSLLSGLDDADWSAATACPDWDVRRMYLHVLGACEAGASIRENVHQLRRARAHQQSVGGPLEAALSAVQVREREHLTPGQLVDRLRAVAPSTIRGRRRLPGVLRSRVRIPVDGPIHETWTLGYLVDTIYLRDLWMHRIDACDATGREPLVTAEHDGRIVADVVGEWARRHGAPFVLELEGEAGGVFACEPDAPAAEHHRLDALEFCRTLAGRRPAAGLLASIVPF